MADDITQPIAQPTKPSRLKFVLIIEAFILLIVIIVGLFIFIKRKNQTTKNSTPSPTPTTQTENKMNVPMETKYENPFSDKTQYQNPFSKNTNPFDNLK
jgi:flagellar basal body-associated protein FliL